MVVGFWEGLWGAMTGLLFLMLFHEAVTLYRRIRKQPMQGGRRYAYPFAPFLLLGMGCILLSGGTKEDKMSVGGDCAIVETAVAVSVNLRNKRRKLIYGKGTRGSNNKDENSLRIKINFR